MKSNLLRGVWWSNDGTPLYTSLLDIMDDMNTAIQRTSTKVIVVFSDGEPSDYGEDDVCERATALGVKIVSIGYGPSSIKSATKSNAAVGVLQRLATCSGGSYLAIEDISEIGTKASELAQALTEGHLDLSCNLSDPTQILAEESVVEGTATLVLRNGSAGGPVAFSFIPPADSMVPAGLPGQDPATIGPTCPQPEVVPIIDPRPPQPPLVCPEGTADLDGDGDCEEAVILPPDCTPGGENFPACLVINAQTAAECQAEGGHWVAGGEVAVPAHLYAQMQAKGHGYMTLPDGTVLKYSTFNGITNWQVMGRCLSEAGFAISAGGDADEGDGSNNCSLTPNAPTNRAQGLLLLLSMICLLWLRRRTV